MMKSKLYVLILALAVILAGCGPAGGGDIKTVNIKELTADPSAYSGKIAVTGIVQNVNEKSFLLTVIDEEEYKTCGLNPCGTAGILTIYTPDSSKPMGKTPSDYTYDVQLPKIEDKVTVEGVVKKLEGGYAFEVEKVVKGSKAIIAKK